MREIPPEEVYTAADWIARELVPAMCRQVTCLPWPSLDGLPDMSAGVRRAGPEAAERIHPRMQAAYGACVAALGDAHQLTQALQLASAIVNECKFKRLSANIRETAMTRVVQIAQIAVALNIEIKGATAVAGWEPLADEGVPFDELIGPAPGGAM